MGRRIGAARAARQTADRPVALPATQNARSTLAPPPRPPMSTQSDLERRFVCAKCSRTGARVRTISTSGGTLSRMMNFQHNRFLAASCTWCGYTELYDADTLGARGRASDVFDLLFGA